MRTRVLHVTERETDAHPRAQPRRSVPTAVLQIWASSSASAKWNRRRADSQPSRAPRMAARAGRGRRLGRALRAKCVRILELRHHEKSVTRAGKSRYEPTATAGTTWTRAVLTDPERTPSPQPLPFLNRAPGKPAGANSVVTQLRRPAQRTRTRTEVAAGRGKRSRLRGLHRVRFPAPDAAFYRRLHRGGAGPRDFSLQPPVHL